MKEKIIDYGNFVQYVSYDNIKSDGYYKSLSYNNKQIREQRKILLADLEDEIFEDAMKVFGSQLVHNEEGITYAEMVADRFKNNLYRTKKKFRELLLCNLPLGDAWFMTLEYEGQNGYDYEQLKRDYYNFRRKFTEFDVNAIAVPEKHKKGNFHIHLIMFDVPSYFDYDKIKKRWGKARFLYVKKITEKKLENIEKLANYLIGYMTKKSYQNAMIKNRRQYWPTQKLKKPSVITDSKKLVEYKERLASDYTLLLDKSHHSQYHGLMISRMFLAN